MNSKLNHNIKKPIKGEGLLVVVIWINILKKINGSKAFVFEWTFIVSSSSHKFAFTLRFSLWTENNISCNRFTLLTQFTFLLFSLLHSSLKKLKNNSNFSSFSLYRQSRERSFIFHCTSQPTEVSTSAPELNHLIKTKKNIFVIRASWKFWAVRWFSECSESESSSRCRRQAWSSKEIMEWQSLGGLCTPDLF